MKVLTKPGVEKLWANIVDKINNHDYKDTGALDAFAKPFEVSGKIVRCAPIAGSAVSIQTNGATSIIHNNKNLNIDDVKLGIRPASNGTFWNAEASGSAYGYMSHENIIPVIPGETYSLSFAGRGNFHSILYYKDEVYTGEMYQWPPATFTVPEDVNGIGFNLTVTTGTAMSATAYDLQIELGEQITDYVKGERETIDVTGDVMDIEAFSGDNLFWSDADFITVSGYTDIQEQLAAVTEFDEQKFVGSEGVLFLAGDTAGMSKDNAVELQWQYGTRVGICSVKWQGSSSLGNPKKNYTIVFDDPVSFGWGAQTKYCFKSDYIDPSRARNVVSARLWGEIVGTRTNAPAKLLAAPNKGAIDGNPICINLNGEFHGVYTVTIPKEPWLFGMSETSTTPQAFVCAEGNDAARFKAPITQFGPDFDLEYNYNDDEEWVKNSLNTLINACINSDGTDLDTTVAQYLDWDSAIDYYIFSTLITGIDIIERNYILVTYDGVKWYFSAYDMDMTFGLGFTNTFLRDDAEPSLNSSSRMHRVFELIKAYKADALRERYLKLRDGVMSESFVCMMFRNFCTKFPQAVLDEDLKRWPKIKTTSVNDAAQICDNYRGRAKIVDKWMGVAISDLNPNEVITISKVDEIYNATIEHT